MFYELEENYFPYVLFQHFDPILDKTYKHYLSTNDYNQLQLYYNNPVYPKELSDIIHYFDSNGDIVYLNDILDNKFSSLDDILNISLQDIDFKIRINNALLRNQIYTLKDLLKCNYDF